MNHPTVEELDILAQVYAAEGGKLPLAEMTGRNQAVAKRVAANFHWVQIVRDTVYIVDTGIAALERHHRVFHSKKK